MERCCYYFFLLLAMTVAFSPSRAKDSLEDTCRILGRGSDAQYNFCVTSLQAVPGIREADAYGLTLIVSNLTMVNYTNTMAKITELLESTNLTRPEEVCVSACKKQYNVAIPKLQEAIDDIKSRNFTSEKTWITIFHIIKAPITCEDSFEEDRVKSLLAKEDENCIRLAALVSALIGTFFGQFLTVP